MKVLILVVSFFASAWAHADDWTLKEEREGMRIYSRMIEGSPHLWVKVETTIPKPLQCVVQTAYDTNQFTRWMDTIIKAEVQHRVSAYDYTTYLVAESPMLLPDRDMVTRSNVFRWEDGTVTLGYKAVSQSDPGYVAEKDGLVRITQVEGEMRFSEPSAGVTDIRYVTHLDPGGVLPAFVTNMAAYDVPTNTVQNLARLVPECSERIDLAAIPMGTAATGMTE